MYYVWYLPIKLETFLMIQRLAILTLFISTISFGQVQRISSAKKNIYNGIDRSTFVDSISQNDIVGGFSKSNGTCGYHFQLDSNMTFQKIYFSCEARFKVD